MAPQRTTPGAAGDRRVFGLAGSIMLSASVSMLVMVSSWQSDTRLGAPLYWTWVLTGLQVLALWAAGRRLWWAWLLGAGVQPVWVVYALLTGQVGFIAGCVISAAVQWHNFLNQPNGPRRVAAVCDRSSPEGRLGIAPQPEAQSQVGVVVGR